MSEASGSSMLYFIVGGLLVGVLGIGYLAFNGGGGEGTNVSVSAPAAVADPVPASGTKVKIDLTKDGQVTGSFEKEE